MSCPVLNSDLSSFYHHIANRVLVHRTLNTNLIMAEVTFAQWIADSLEFLHWSHVTILLLLTIPLILTLTAQTRTSRELRKNLRHLQKLGISLSNMSDQYDSKFDNPLDTKARIKALFIHPVKSCAPIELDRALLTKTGFKYDRCFALASEVARADAVEGSVWRFLSQRTKPLMSQIETEIWVPHHESSLKDWVQGGCLVLRFPDPDVSTWLRPLRALGLERSTSFMVPLEPTPDMITSFNLELKPFAIHGREARGLSMSKLPTVASALPKLKRFLRLPNDQSLDLIRCTPETLVRTDKNLAPLEHIGTPAVHGYTDQQPININSLSSVHAVSSLLPVENQPLNALRFRANIWITGTPAFDEDSWKRYRILSPSRQTVTPLLSVVCRTSRCTMPNVNPTNGKFDTNAPSPDTSRGKPQPSTTLVKHRTVEDGNPRALGYLGMHCVPEDQSLKEADRQGTGLYINVGDEIEVLERGIHLYGSTGNDY